MVETTRTYWRPGQEFVGLTGLHSLSTTGKAGTLSPAALLFAKRGAFYQFCRKRYGLAHHPNLRHRVVRLTRRKRAGFFFLSFAFCSLYCFLDIGLAPPHPIQVLHGKKPSRETRMPNALGGLSLTLVLLLIFMIIHTQPHARRLLFSIGR